MLTLFIVYRASTISAERLCTKAATYKPERGEHYYYSSLQNQSDYKDDLTILLTFIGNYGSSLLVFFSNGIVVIQIQFQDLDIVYIAN